MPRPFSPGRPPLALRADVTCRPMRSTPCRTRPSRRQPAPWCGKQRRRLRAGGRTRGRSEADDRRPKPCGGPLDIRGCRCTVSPSGPFCLRSRTRYWASVACDASLARAASVRPCESDRIRAGRVGRSAPWSRPCRPSATASSSTSSSVHHRLAESSSTHCDVVATHNRGATLAYPRRVAGGRSCFRLNCRCGLPVVGSVASPRRSVLWRESNQARKPPEKQ
jgi:hypothetical protein